ncbi:MAG: nuclear transport factor 2 family protein [Novosphingobium sp.]|nr:nuclear transport factor 2 family protein [Novosphingobium sp.]
MSDHVELNVPGGRLDPAHADKRDVFIDTPVDAKASPAYRLAQTYVEHVQAREFHKLPDLFTDDAVIYPPLRRAPVVGRAKIVDFYENTIAKVTPIAKAVSIYGEGNDCFMELSIPMDVDGEQRYVLTTIDHFTLAPDGRFSRMIVYLRP